VKEMDENGKLKRNLKNPPINDTVKYTTIFTHFLFVFEMIKFLFIFRLPCHQVTTWKLLMNRWENLLFSNDSL
jgi:hypothetical protein